MGGVGGGRKLETTPSHPRPDGGDKRERPSQRLQGQGYTESGLVRDPMGRVLRPPTAPTPADTHLPAPSLTGATAHAAQTPSPAGSEAAQPQVRSLPGIPAEESAQAGGARVRRQLPQPPPHSLTVPPTASRRFPGHRSARFWPKQAGRPGSCGPAGDQKRGTPGPRAGGTGVSEPTLLASSLLRSIRARVRDSDPRHKPVEGAQEAAARTRASGYCGEGGEGSLPASVWGTEV